MSDAADEGKWTGMLAAHWGRVSPMCAPISLDEASAEVRRILAGTPSDEACRDALERLLTGAFVSWGQPAQLAQVTQIAAQPVSGRVELLVDDETFWLEDASELLARLLTANRSGVSEILFSEDSPIYDPDLARRRCKGLLAGALRSSDIVSDLAGFRDEILSAAKKALGKRVKSHSRTRRVDDAGAYVPGAAKERPALKKARVTENAGDAVADLSAACRSLGEPKERAIGMTLVSFEINGEESARKIVHLWPAGECALADFGSIVQKGAIKRLRNSVSTLAETKSTASRWSAAARLVREIVDGIAAGFVAAAEEAPKAREGVLVDLAISGNQTQPEFVERLARDTGETLLRGVFSPYISKVRELMDQLRTELGAMNAELEDESDNVKGSVYHEESVRNLSRTLAELERAMELLSGNSTPSARDLDLVSQEWEMATLLLEAKKRAAELGLHGIAMRLGSRTVVKEFIRSGGRDLDDVGTPDDIVKIFGLNGIEFGNYVSDKRRLDLLRRAAASFRDLGDCLGLSDLQMSLRGRLSIGLGSRGKGGDAAASYFPSGRVMNMTRDHGDGSFAHEIGHAIDFCMNDSSVALGAGRDGEMVNVPEDVLDAMKKLKRAMLTSSREDFISRREAEMENSRAKRDNLLVSFKEKEAVVVRSFGDAKAAIDVERKNFRLAIEASNTEDERVVFRAKMVEADEKARRTNHERNVALLNIDHLRLMANELTVEISGIKIDIANARAGLDLRSPRFNSKRIRGLNAEDIIDSLSNAEEAFPSKFVDDSVKTEMRDGGRSGRFKKVEELFARAFETYVAKVMRDKGASNNYLVDLEVLDGKMEETWLYPCGTEALKISEAMAELLTAMKRHKLFGEAV